jgi:hypothetical protein
VIMAVPLAATDRQITTPSMQHPVETRFAATIPCSTASRQSRIRFSNSIGSVYRTRKTWVSRKLLKRASGYSWAPKKTRMNGLEGEHRKDRANDPSSVGGDFARYEELPRIFHVELGPERQRSYSQSAPGVAPQPRISRISIADRTTVASREPAHPSRFEKKTNTHRSPRSPCPLFTLRLALMRRSLTSDFPTSSDSLSRPLLLRLTNRVSVPVLMSSRFEACFRVDFRVEVFFAMLYSGHGVATLTPLGHRCSI